MLKMVNMRVEESLFEEFKELTKGESITAALTRIIKDEVDYKRLKIRGQYPRVIRIIDGKKYDTDTARMISQLRHKNGKVVVLYRKKNGELFIHNFMLGEEDKNAIIITKKHPSFECYLAEMSIDEHSAEAFEE